MTFKFLSQPHQRFIHASRNFNIGGMILSENFGRLSLNAFQFKNLKKFYPGCSYLIFYKKKRRIMFKKNNEKIIY